MSEPEWTVVQEKSGCTTRLEVPGGWLYRHVSNYSDNALSMCFVPASAKELQARGPRIEYRRHGG